MIPIRLQLSRAPGFRLQKLSIATNGFPARACTRPHLFGNPFAVTARTTAERAALAFRRFLRTWTDSQIIAGIKFEGGEPAPMAGLGAVMHRNHIRANLYRLRGHNLGCFCGLDAPCHVDVYLDLLKTDWPERWRARYPKINSVLGGGPR